MSTDSLHSGDADRARAAAVAVGTVLALTLWRLVWGYHDATELSTDEAQYWLWGQDFSFGAYSKPPMIGWLIGAADSVLGQSVFAVRVLAPLLHAVTALLILALALRLVTPRAAALAAVSYATMPAVTLGSALMTTDTPLLTCVAGALLAQHAIAARGGRGWALPVMLGVAIGLGLLSKYAMLYALAGMACAAALSPDWRIGWRATSIAAGFALALITPNLWWIASHGFVTAQHLVEDAEYSGLSLHLGGTVRFLAEQFGVVGPILFASWLVGLRHLAGRGALAGLAVASTLPILIVLVQALTGRVLANWAISFAAAGVIVAAEVLYRRPRLALLSVGLGTVLSLGLPVARVYGTGWTLPNGDRVLARYLGHGDVSDWVMAQAGAQGVYTLLAGSRSLLADLSWAAAPRGLAVRALPHEGGARNHWELMFPFDPGSDAMPAAIVARVGTSGAAICAGQAIFTAHHDAGPGYAAGQGFVMRVIDSPACLAAGDGDG
ncbi:4-amino-4-deoxy-L-arabinose transferase-like glycosyltransferase [Rhodovulum bhavnagarense]|uniref:4-amino-4-deoxy-L-arabinose transferase-like glycosyltransferase n=1 Tax=Rhodovulum bhavnagarense TaxID=992286 RepID=A0A4R2RM30_9RHOB|nr:glycosyltransferase family 39 protein [Rhodovulum bhavnagarense]TCP63317.1 4-amino-4-deoxy-L-arabinose transferase-like glycosyltransferase [Rhodovulum bhavnagarense]